MADNPVEPLPVERLAEQGDSPMYIVTASADGEHAGRLVGIATQCSIDPLRFLVCVSTVDRTFDVVSRAETLVVHALSSLFGEETETDEDVDKFLSCAWLPVRAAPPSSQGATGSQEPWVTESISGTTSASSSMSRISVRHRGWRSRGSAVRVCAISRPAILLDR